MELIETVLVRNNLIVAFSVVGVTIWMLSLAASIRNRSRRALECSGPIPSKP